MDPEYCMQSSLQSANARGLPSTGRHCRRLRCELQARRFHDGLVVETINSGHNLKLPIEGEMNRL
jgi:hypothetical protein